MIKKKILNIYLCIIILSIISIINLYNAKYLNSLYSSIYLKQLLWFIIGLIILIYTKYIKKFINNKYLYIFNIFLLILVLIIGKTINGSKAWLNLGFISFQPSELVKITLPITLNYLINLKLNKFIKLILGLILTLIPSILVFLEPDTGAIIFYCLFFIIYLFKLKLPIKYYLILLFLILLISITLIYLYFNYQDILLKILGNTIFYRIDRILNFKDNYQLNLAKIGIYSSNIFRNGFNNIKLYIPEGHTDFIFAFSISNFGLIIVPIILISYLIIIISINNHNYLSNCFTYMLLFQVIINICMNIGLCPIIGINLPFLSYGGSNMLIYFLFLSYIINMDNY